MTSPLVCCGDCGQPLDDDNCPAECPCAPRPEYDPADYRKCRTCLAPTGTLCAAQSGRIVGGTPDGIRTPLPRPHVARQRRAGR